MPTPTYLLPGANLAERTPDSVLDKLGASLSEHIDDLERENAPYFRSLMHWWDWYAARPRTERKDYPFKNASNIVVPLIQTVSDNLQSRALASVFGAGRRVWEITTENESLQPSTDQMRRFLNWAADGNDFDLFLALYDWTGEMFPIGSSVLALNYRRDVRRLFFGPNAGRKTRTVEFNRGVTVEHIPRHLILWDTRWPIGDAPLVVRQHEYSWSQLKFFAQQARDGRGQWLPKAIESIQSSPTGAYEGPVGNVNRTVDLIDDRRREPTQAARQCHDVREVHVDWPLLKSSGIELDAKMDPDAPEIPVVAHLHRRTRKILRLVATPYHLPCKPFFDGFFRKHSGRGHGVGVAKRLEHVQLGLTTMVNQAIDSVTRSNTVWAKTRDSRHLQQPLDPAHPIYDPTGSFEPLNVGNPIQQNVAMFQLLNVVGERNVGVFDPALGRETRQGGHPSPATSTLALLEQQQVAASSTTKHIRKTLSRLGECIAILYQQYETNEDGKLERVFGARDAAELGQLMFPTEPIPSNFMFDVTAMNETLNPDSQMRRAVLVNQVNDVYWSRILQGVQVLESPQVGPVTKMAWLDFIKSTTNSYRRILDAANVDEVEEFLVRIQAANQTAGRDFTNSVGAIGEIAAGAGGVPPAGPVGGANGRAPVGAVGSAAGGGAQLLPQ